MLALVTGGSGFIGSHVVDRLKAHGVEVRIFDMILPRFRKDIEFYHGSILDPTAVLMASLDVDVIFHLAAVADVKDVFEQPHYSESVNVRGTINVLEAARRCKVQRLVYGSTTWVYGDVPESRVTEETLLRSPSHLYTATKIASEFYCQSYSRLYGVPTTILRYGIPYGPRGRDGAVIPIFVRKALNGEKLTIAGDGSQFRQFVYVEDLAEGNVLALKSVAKDRIYNLDGNRKFTIKEIAETIKLIVGEVQIQYIPGRSGDFSGKEVSSKRAKHELMWEPRVSLEEGISRYIEWFKEREHLKASKMAEKDPVLE